jgi:hypothetical protein
VSQAVIKVGLAMAVAGLLPSCFGVQAASVRRPGAVALNYQFSPPVFESPTRVAQLPSATPSMVLATQGSVRVRGFHEPGDFAHRNYCGAGATQVLLSAWLADVPNIEVVAHRSGLNPNRGEYAVQATAAINSFLAPAVQPSLGHSWYTAAHITSLQVVEARIRGDIDSQRAIRLFGHGAPVIAQTMTYTMPGWSHWNATHMIAIFAFNFSHNNPNLDTVTYAETPSPLAGYRGPDFQTITVSALWVAMQAYLREAPYDPNNVIS